MRIKKPIASLKPGERKMGIKHIDSKKKIIKKKK